MFDINSFASNLAAILLIWVFPAMNKDLHSDSDSGKDPDTSGSLDLPFPPEEKVTAFTSLRIPNFRLLLTGSIISNAAQWIQMVTLSWLVYYLTG